MPPGSEASTTEIPAVPVEAPRAPPATLPAGLNKDVHLPALDGLRGLAVLLVIVHHSLLGWKPARTPLEGLIEKIVGHGWVGVDLFFVLSGFLITGILLDTREKPRCLRSFYPRRMLRTFPLYYATLAVCFLLLPLLPWGAPAGVRALSEHQGWFWLHVSNLYTVFFDVLLASGPDAGWMSTFWSLAVEEHFYLIWPLVVLACPPRSLAAVCGILFALGLGFRMVLAWKGCTFDLVYYATPTRLDGLLLGSFVAVLSRRPGGLRGLAAPARILLPSAAILLGILSLAGGGHSSFFGRTFVFSLVALAFASLMVWAIDAPMRSPVRRLASLRLLRTCGKYSYAMYILNIPLLHLLKLVFVPDDVRVFRSRIPGIALYAGVGVALSLAGAWITWHVLEKHCLKLKRRFTPG